mmetsp:Transcript_1646/g.5454  ORF Transcript_1646/g.5454 Transcript_1646/m.5454 type:complete len:202 (-) Transcript_1646:1443-2048(-)
MRGDRARAAGVRGVRPRDRAPERRRRVRAGTERHRRDVDRVDAFGARKVRRGRGVLRRDGSQRETSRAGLAARPRAAEDRREAPDARQGGGREGRERRDSREEDSSGGLENDFGVRRSRRRGVGGGAREVARRDRGRGPERRRRRRRRKRRREDGFGCCRGCRRGRIRRGRRRRRSDVVPRRRRRHRRARARARGDRLRGA